MVQAATGLVPILVDCSQRGAHEDLKQKYAVRGFPTVLFLDSKGDKVEELASRAAPQVVEQIRRVIQQHSRPVVAESTIDEGLSLAREQRKLLIVAFVDGQDPETGALLDLILSPPMEEVRGRFHWIRRPATGERNRATDEAKEWGARKAPTLVVVDPWAEGDEREVKKVTSFRSLPRDLQKALEAAEKKGHPPAADAAPPAEGE